MQNQTPSRGTTIYEIDKLSDGYQIRNPNYNILIPSGTEDGEF